MKDKVRGKVEEVASKVTDDKVLRVKGRERQNLGEIKEAAKSIAHNVEQSKRKR